MLIVCIFWQYSEWPLQCEAGGGATIAAEEDQAGAADDQSRLQHSMTEGSSGEPEGYSELLYSHNSYTAYLHIATRVP